jgi:hypothetical protein
MSISFSFPTGLYRAIGEDQVAVVAHDYDGTPAVVCVFADSAFQRAAALVLLENNPDSFVVSHGRRYAPGGHVEAYDPTRPCYAGELCLLFEVEWVELGPQPQIYVFTHTEQEWVTARLAMKHLLHLGRLSSRSYLEGDHAGFAQGLSAKNLDSKPHGPGLVAQFRDAAIRAQNEDDGSEFPADLYLLFVLEAKERREQSASERAEDDSGWEEENDEEEPAGIDTGMDLREETIQEVSVQAPQRILSLARWRQGGNIVKRLMFRDSEHF